MPSLLKNNNHLNSNSFTTVANKLELFLDFYRHCCVKLKIDYVSLTQLQDGTNEKRSSEDAAMEPLKA
jgi:hypothetical protein